MGLQNSLSHQEPTRDATEDYPQSGRTFQVLCVRKNPMGGRNRAADDGSGGTCPQKRASDLRRLRSAGAGLRPSAGAAIRVCAAVGDRRVLHLCDATGELPNLRRDRGTGAVGGGEVSSDDQLPLVSGSLGKAPGLGGSGRLVSHHLEK